jgi:hypothetical protein
MWFLGEDLAAPVRSRFRSRSRSRSRAVVLRAREVVVAVMAAAAAAGFLFVATAEGEPLAGALEALAMALREGRNFRSKRGVWRESSQVEIVVEGLS